MSPFSKPNSSNSVASAAESASEYEEVDIGDILVSFDDDVALDSSELELSDEDFVVLDPSPPALPMSRAALRATLAAVRPTAAPRETTRRSAEPVVAKRRLAPAPRAPRALLASDDDAEARVADEYLALVAAEALRTRASVPSLVVAEPPSSRPVAPSRVVPIGKLPSASLPPRSSLTIPPPPSSSSPALSLSRRPARVAPPLFVQGSLDRAPSFAGTFPEYDDLSFDHMETLPLPIKAPLASSLAPVAFATTSPPPLVVVRERPLARTAWLLAAAAVGALGAVAGMHVLGSPMAPASGASITIGAPPPSALPTARAEASSAPKKGSVVRFGEREAVSIKVPPPSPPTPARTAPHAQPAARGAAHGARPAGPPRVSAPPLLPDGARKKALTPEQELAEGQLRAATP